MVASDRKAKIIWMGLVPKVGCDEGWGDLQALWTSQPLSSELGMWST